jgi:hypothetical protein
MVIVPEEALFMTEPTAPDPLPEIQMKRQIASTIEVEWEDSIDPQDEHQVRESLEHLLQEVSERLQKSSLCYKFRFYDSEIVGP